MCGKTFRKPTGLSLHRQTHILEQQSAKGRAYQCTECKQTLRSRTLLTKHMDVAHNSAERRKSELNDSDVGQFPYLFFFFFAVLEYCFRPLSAFPKIVIFRRKLVEYFSKPTLFYVHGLQYWFSKARSACKTFSFKNAHYEIGKPG